MTTKTSLRSRTIGEIAATLPGATAVFRKFKLDFCCGGDALLATAVGERGADIAAIEAALAELDPHRSPPAPEATGDLIDYLVNRYHESHRHELPELIRLARKVEVVHAGHPESPQGLSGVLEAVYTELEEHMRKEETELFPLMRRGDGVVGDGTIAELRHEHDRHGERLRRLETIANGFVLPEGACRSWQALNTGVAKFVDDLMNHIHLENNVLFPRFEPREAAGSPDAARAS